MHKRTVSTLAVGTEVTEGQIVDRNSAWLSHQAADLGFQILEHRAVADDRNQIYQALQDLSAKSDFVFLTGGLGPTSDDFTREVVADYCRSELELNDSSWQRVQEKLAARKLPRFDAHKKQCYFPKGSRILVNSAGTADGFALQKFFVLPGPPAEVAAIWNECMAAELKQIIPESERTQLLIFRCLGKSESEIAEIVEKIIAGRGIQIGYRAHVPYVEVKLWLSKEQMLTQATCILDLQNALKNWLVGRENEDVADLFLEDIRKFKKIFIIDAASKGILAERLSQVLREKKLDLPIQIQIENVFPENAVFWIDEKIRQTSDEAALFLLVANAQRGTWHLGGKFVRMPYEAEIQPPYVYQLQSERACKFIAEKAMLTFRHWLAERPKFNV